MRYCAPASSLNPLSSSCAKTSFPRHDMLELLRKNPVGAIPIILRRLKQKGLEWRKVRSCFLSYGLLACDRMR